MNWLEHLFSRRKLHSELAEEIREHLEEKVEELVEGGMSREEAAYAARREFGNVTLIEESGREVWRWAPVEDFFMDVRFGARMLRKNPGFAAVAIVTLALGIAVNTTIFSAVNGWMLRRPRIKDPARVVVIVTTDPAKGGWGWDRQPVSAFDFVAWREQSRSFEAMVASEPGEFVLSEEGEPERVLGLRVSADYFHALGVEAATGRTFLADEDQFGRNRVVILSHGLWQRRFGSNPKVMGEIVRLNGESYTVIGVMSSNYRIGVYGGPELWTPLGFPPESLLPAARGNRSLEVMARLKSGASVETARAEMVALAQRSEQAHPGTSKGWSASAMSIQHYIADEFGVGMRLQMGMVLFVLFIACVNIASLQLARGAERQTEFSSSEDSHERWFPASVAARRCSLARDRGVVDLAKPMPSGCGIFPGDCTKGW
jgi:predicted permease